MTTRVLLRAALLRPGLSGPARRCAAAEAELSRPASELLPGGRGLRPSHVPRRPFKQELRSRPCPRARTAPPAARRTARPRPAAFCAHPPRRPRGSPGGSGVPAPSWAAVVDAGPHAPRGPPDGLPSGGGDPRAWAERRGPRAGPARWDPNPSPGCWGNPVRELIKETRRKLRSFGGRRSVIAG